jgi:leucyl/phenylalanyl-tRNA--protein transferase
MIELTPDMLVAAYAQGLFPMAEDAQSADIGWYDPPFRGILPITGFHVPASLKKIVRRRDYIVTYDRDFAGVMRACADSRDKTWINPQIIDAYVALHRAGHAHSVEVRGMDGTLQGGLYGVSINAAFFGESMFSYQPNASKKALVHLVARLWSRRYTLLDTQFVNRHLLQFGCREIPRAAYRRLLAEALAKKASFADQSVGRFSSGSSAAGFSAAGLESLTASGAAAGALSVENDSSFRAVDLFLQEITQTS